MKKVLSTVAALGLIAGLASTAGAVEFKMSGKYLVEGAYLSDSRTMTYTPSTYNPVTDVTVAGTPFVATGVTPNRAVGVSDNPSDAYWLHTFEIKPTMKVNDKVSMSAVIRLADDTFWGGQTNGDTEGLSGTNDVYVHQLYMDYASPIGNMKFGRTPAGTYGTSFMDADKRANRVMLYPSFLAAGPWSTLFYLEKATDNFAAATTYTGNQSDIDSDTYVARLYYKTDSLDAGLHYGYSSNKTGTMSVPHVTVTPILQDMKQQLTAYGKYKMDNFFVNGELTHFFGSVDFTDADSTDYDSWAGMLQVGAKFDALTPSLMYFYAQGQSDSNDIENALGTTGTGDQFEPLYILTGRHTGMLNNDLFNANTATMSGNGVHAIVAAADYAVSNQLTLHGAIGWAKADEVQIAGQDDKYGWEYNVGAAYKLLDNLTYEAHFGYLDTGDFFKSTTSLNDSNTENVYILTHSLTMTF